MSKVPKVGRIRSRGDEHVGPGRVSMFARLGQIPLSASKHGPPAHAFGHNKFGGNAHRSKRAKMQRRSLG